MAKHNKVTTVNMPMFIAACLFCLTLISVHLTSGLYAKYTASASGNDFVRVTAFGDLTLIESGDFYESNKLIIVPGVELTKKAVVNFTGSETATYVFAEVQPSAAWQTTDGYTFSVTFNDKTAMEWSIAEGWELLTEENGTYVYYRELAPGTVLNDVDIIAEDGRIAVSDRITKSEIASMTGISVKLRASVVQSGGFTDPGAAWDSVAAKEG